MSLDFYAAAGLVGFLAAQEPPIQWVSDLKVAQQAMLCRMIGALASNLVSLPVVRLDLQTMYGIEGGDIERDIDTLKTRLITLFTYKP